MLTKTISVITFINDEKNNLRFMRQIWLLTTHTMYCLCVVCVLDVFHVTCKKAKPHNKKNVINHIPSSSSNKKLYLITAYGWYSWDVQILKPFNSIEIPLRCILSQLLDYFDLIKGNVSVWIWAAVSMCLCVWTFSRNRVFLQVELKYII